MGSRFRTGVQLIPAAMQQVHALFPSNAAKALMKLTGYSHSHSEKLAAGHRGIGAEQLARLVLAGGKEGFQVLEAMIAELPIENQREFWKWAGRAAERATRVQKLRQIRRELEELDAADLTSGS